MQNTASVSVWASGCLFYRDEKTIQTSPITFASFLQRSTTAKRFAIDSSLSSCSERHWTGLYISVPRISEAFFANLDSHEPFGLAGLLY